MLAAAQQTAAVTLTAEVDVTALVAIRRQLQQLRAASDDPAPGYTAMFVKLAGAALAVHPGLTQQWTEHGLLTPDGMHVNVAVDAPQGLVTPLVRDVSELSLVEIGRQIRELAALARTRRLTPEQLQPGAFTVTNLGGYAVDAFTPLLNLPQAAILGVGRIREAPLVRDGAVVAGYAAALSLTFDHRVVDGAPAAELLTTLAAMAEAPLTVLLD
jgi:pyruvate dehydrogenase E2 component (dihydrolipoamide acetyltransferase)